MNSKSPNSKLPTETDEFAEAFLEGIKTQQETLNAQQSKLTDLEDKLSNYIHEDRKLMGEYQQEILECNDKVKAKITEIHGLKTRNQWLADEIAKCRKEIDKPRNEIEKPRNNILGFKINRSNKNQGVRVGGNRRQLRSTKRINKLHKSKTYRKKSKTYRKKSKTYRKKSKISQK